MADALAAMGQASTVTPAPKREQTVYESGAGRKVAFSFIFLLLLPFFISLPPMLFWRLSQGQWLDTIGLMILAAGFTFVMVLVIIELMHSLRARVELGEKSVKMTLPSGRGPTPVVRYATHDIPYDQIQAVETRREIYGGSVAPVLLKGARLILKDGGGLLRPHWPQRGRARRFRPKAHQLRATAQDLLGKSYPDAGHAPRQRCRDAIPLRHLYV